MVPRAFSGYARQLIIFISRSSSADIASKEEIYENSDLLHQQFWQNDFSNFQQIYLVLEGVYHHATVLKQLL